MTLAYRPHADWQREDKDARVRYIPRLGFVPVGTVPETRVSEFDLCDILTWRSHNGVAVRGWCHKPAVAYVRDVDGRMRYLCQTCRRKYAVGA